MNRNKIREEIKKQVEKQIPQSRTDAKKLTQQVSIIYKVPSLKEPIKK